MSGETGEGQHGLGDGARGLAMAFQAARTGYSALMWGIKVGCIRSPYEANAESSPEVENTAQPGFAAYQLCLR